MHPRTRGAKGIPDSRVSRWTAAGIFRQSAVLFVSRASRSPRASASSVWPACMRRRRASSALCPMDWRELESIDEPSIRSA
eukprot:scaffold157661_cov35-Tisochrysis_lutea.AAC.1